MSYPNEGKREPTRPAPLDTETRTGFLPSGTLRRAAARVRVTPSLAENLLGVGLVPHKLVDAVALVFHPPVAEFVR